MCAGRLTPTGFNITQENGNREKNGNEPANSSATDIPVSPEPPLAKPVLEYASPMPVAFRLSKSTKILLGCGLFVFVASMAASYDSVEYLRAAAVMIGGYVYLVNRLRKHSLSRAGSFQLKLASALCIVGAFEMAMASDGELISGLPDMHARVLTLKRLPILVAGLLWFITVWVVEMISQWRRRRREMASGITDASADRC